MRSHGRGLVFGESLGIIAGVQLNAIGPDRLGPFDHLDDRIDKNRYPNAGMLQALGNLREKSPVLDGIPALTGCQYVRTIRYQGGLSRGMSEHQIHISFGWVALNIEFGSDDFTERRNIAIADMALVGPWVYRDALPAKGLAIFSYLYQVGQIALPGITDERYFINVDAKSGHEFCIYMAANKIQKCENYLSSALSNLTNACMDPIDDNPLKFSHPPLVSFLLLLILATLIGTLLGGGVSVGIGLAMGLDITQMSAPSSNTPEVRTFLRLGNLVSHLFTFTLAGLVFSWLFYRRQIWAFLQLHRPPTARLTGLGVLWVLVSFPFAQSLYWINRQLPMPDYFLRMEESATRLLEVIMTMNTPGELLLNILVIGVAPAVGEELIFRGILQRRLQCKIHPVAAVWVTALIFSAIHLQFAGFLPRMLLGALLGYLFLWSRNLWVPIIAHFFFNVSQVVGQYLYGEQISQLEVDGPDEPYWLSGVFSLVLLMGIGWFIWRRARPQDGEKE